MTNTELQTLLTAADPLPAERADRLELHDAEADLLAGLIAEPRPARSRPTGVRARRGRNLVRFGLPIAATALLLIALLSLRDGSSDGGSGTAWAAEQVRFAEASPLVLLDAPGWRVDYADEQSREEGELHFRTGPAPKPEDQLIEAVDVTPPTPADRRSAELNWRGGEIQSWFDDRAASASATSTAPVLGTRARVYQYNGGTPGHRDITALFRYDGRVLEFRTGAAGINAFKGLLAKLKRVDTDTWLSAMPPSVIKTPDRASTIRQMLRGVPLPPGFDPKDIRGAHLVKDRYQLGAAVAGTIACRWFQRWAVGRQTGDRGRVREAIAALATARTWPVLKQMEREGGYPSVLYEYAAAMPSGDWYGRPLLGELDNGLGCDTRGVRLP
jgi:hypothetical protein